MQFIFILLLTLFSSNIKGEDLKELIISGSDITSVKSFELSNKNKFSSFEVSGSWTDNYGNYGLNSCMGIINKNLKNIELNFMCERVDKNGYKIWSNSIKEFLE